MAVLPKRGPELAKLLLLVAVAAIVYALLRNYQRAIARQQDQTPAAAQPRTVAEDMVCCDRCGVHLPRSEGFLSQGRYFCSDDHRKLGPK